MQVFTACGNKGLTRANGDLFQSFQAICDKRRTGDRNPLDATARKIAQCWLGRWSDPLRPAQTRLKGNRVAFRCQANLVRDCLRGEEALRAIAVEIRSGDLVTA